MNITEEENAFTQRVASANASEIDIDIITCIETVNSLARKKITDYLKKHQINYQQWRILKAIYLDLAKTPAKVSAATFTDSGTISRQLELLEAKGLVRREHSKQDRRVVNLMLSDKGQHIARDGINFTEQLIDCVRNEIGEKKVIEFQEALLGTLRCSAFNSL